MRTRNLNNAEYYKCGQFSLNKKCPHYRGLTVVHGELHLKLAPVQWACSSKINLISFMLPKHMLQNELPKVYSRNVYQKILHSHIFPGHTSLLMTLAISGLGPA